MPSLSRYEVLTPIGDNHYARFFKGYDVVGERDVCIIEFLEKFRRNEGRWNEIWQQILSAGRIKHEYMVNVYDYDKDRGWVITELMQGSLREVPSEQLKNVELVRSVLYRTLETLDFLHANHHPHGDVRPANLLYDIAGHSKLSYSPGIVLGDQIPRREKDYAFLAPELFDPSFGAVGVGVDLYGCGMSALSMLLGDEFAKKLLGVAVSDDVAWQRFHRDLNSHPSVRTLLPSLPPDMEMVIQKLISKKVDQRFTSITEARALLIRPAEEVKIHVPEASAAPPARRGPSGPPAAFKAPVAPVGGLPSQAHKKPRPVRDWLNQKLKNPLVMGLVSAVIVAMMIFAMALVNEIKRRGRAIPVAVSTKPAGATIYIDGEKQAVKTDGQVDVRRGTRKLKLELEGYQPVEREVPIPPDVENFDIATIELVKLAGGGKPKAVIDPPRTPIESAKPVSNPLPAKAIARWQLPPGLEPIGEERDAETGLPRTVVSVRFKTGLPSEDVVLTFVLLPAGKFMAGANEPLEAGELATTATEIAAPFYVAQYEVTQAQFALFQKTQPDRRDQEPPADVEPNRPATGMSFTDAIAFCKWLGPEFTLPTEHEWEWAARGAEGRPFPWGAESPAADFVRLKVLSSDASEAAAPVAVTDFERGRTPEGISHLLGNVAEWCRDKYVPGSGETDKTSGARALHVIRGGSFRSPGTGLVRVTWRANAPDQGANDVGLRIVCHPVGPQQ